MGITAPLRAHRFFGGGSSSSTLVPYRYPVALDGRPYMIDTVRAEEWRHETVPLLRPQTDDSSQPGEASINPEGLWRRSFRSWHKGTGQRSLDLEESSPFRFTTSIGVDVWTPHQLSLLHAIDQKHTSSNTNLKLCVAGNRLFLCDGAAVTYTEDITVGSPTWTGCTNEPGGTILDMTTDGEYVWITDGSNSFWADASASPPAFNLAGWTGTQDADVLGFVKGRLMSGHNGDATLHTYDASGAATAVTISATLPATWTWVGFAGGPTTSVIYAAGYVGDKSLIFRIGIQEDGSGLDAAIVAGELPDGEIVRSIGSYLGNVLIGTDNGVRFAVSDATGNLEIGALLETGSPCRCFEGQGTQVWFGWDGYTESQMPTSSVAYGVSWTGLGRFSLEEFSSVEKVAPAYATDLMRTATAVTSSVVTFQDRRVWCSEGTDMGVYAEEATAGSAGYVLTSLTSFGFTGDKTAVAVDVGYENPSGGAVLAQVEEDDSEALSTVASISTAGVGNASFGAGNLRGSRFKVAIGLTASSASPVLRTLTLKVSPGVRSTRFITVPLLFNEHLDPDGGVEFFDVSEQRNLVESWWATRQPITYQELTSSYQVEVSDFQWFPRLRDHPHEGFDVDGTMVVRLKELL